MKGARYKRRPYRNGYAKKHNHEPRSSTMFAYNYDCRNNNPYGKFSASFGLNSSNASIEKMLRIWEIMDFKDTPLKYDGIDIIRRDPFYHKEYLWQDISEEPELIYSLEYDMKIKQDEDEITEDMYIPKDGTQLIARILPDREKSYEERLANAFLISRAPFLFQMVGMFLYYYINEDKHGEEEFENTIDSIVSLTSIALKEIDTRHLYSDANMREFIDFDVFKSGSPLFEYLPITNLTNITVEDIALMTSEETGEEITSRCEELANRIINTWTVMEIKNHDLNQTDYVVTAYPHPQEEPVHAIKDMSIVAYLSGSKDKDNIEEIKSNAVLISRAPVLYWLLNQFMVIRLNNIKITQDKPIVRIAMDVWRDINEGEIYYDLLKVSWEG